MPDVARTAGWQLPGPAVLHWRHWDGEWVVFDECVGQTLQPDTFTAAVLMALEGGVAQFDAIAQQVADDLALPISQPLSDRLADCLNSLRSLGWVEPKPQ